MEPLASVDELEARLEWALTDEEKNVAQAALEDLSDEARYYGNSAWITPAATPLPVSRLVLKAASRYMRNPDGFTTSRAGDETVTWSDRGMGSGSPEFTENEIRTLRGYGGGKVMLSAPVVAWESQDIDTVGYIPVDGSQFAGEPKVFPMFGEGYV